MFARLVFFTQRKSRDKFRAKHEGQSKGEKPNEFHHGMGQEVEGVSVCTIQIIMQPSITCHSSQSHVRYYTILDDGCMSETID